MNISSYTPVRGAFATAGHDSHPQLSPSALKVRDRFRDLTGLDRSIVHELGHAVVAAYLDHPVEKVTVEAEGILGGACFYRIRPEELGNNRLTADKAVVTMGAKAAVVRALYEFDLTEIEWDCSSGVYQDEYGIDERTLRACARCLNVPPARLSLWMEALAQAAWDILSIAYVWQALTRLAKELKRERTLTGARVYEVLAHCKAEAGVTA